MPVLLGFLDTAIASEKMSSSVTKVFYALESFIEVLGRGLEVYLPLLMEKLFLALNHTRHTHIQELVMSAFGAVGVLL